MRDEKLNRRIRDAFVAGSISAALIFLIIRVTIPTRVVAEQVDRSEQRLRELLSTQDQLKSMREQAEQDRNALNDFLRHCRSAEDIPDFQGEHVIAYRDRRRLACYVPEGKHQLKISAVWELNQTNPSQNQPAANEPKKEKTWMVSLRGNTGYMLEVISDPEAQLLRWDLSANDPEFESRKETVLMGDFEHAGNAYIRVSPMMYPNQVQQIFSPNTDRIRQWEEFAKASLGLHLFNVRFDAKPGSDRMNRVSLSARLLSEGPAQVAASEAVSIIDFQRPDLLMPYKGGGKYELRAPK